MNTDKPIIRKAQPGDEAAIHEAHMRSIREICIKDHGAEEVLKWGNRRLDDRWFEAIRGGSVWVVEWNGAIHGHGLIKIFNEDRKTFAHIYGLYLTPEVLHQGQGFKLATLMIEHAKKSGAQSITLKSTLTAHDFYKKLGFVDTGPVSNTDLGGFSVRGYPMVLELRSEA